MMLPSFLHCYGRNQGPTAALEIAELRSQNAIQHRIPGGLYQPVSSGIHAKAYFVQASHIP